MDKLKEIEELLHWYKVEYKDQPLANLFESIDWLVDNLKAARIKLYEQHKQFENYQKSIRRQWQDRQDYLPYEEDDRR